jgi:Flp pilus assembly protein TadD
LFSEFSPTRRPVRHWDRAAVFAVIAALPPTVLLALEAGTVVRVLAIISGTKVASPPPPLLIPGADNIAWAWVIFFVVLAFVYLTDAGPGRSEWVEPEPVGDYVEPQPEPEPEVVVAAPREAVTDEPTVETDDALPVVPNLPEAQAWLEKGSELQVSGHYDQAIAHFDRALVLNPRLAGAWAGKGLASNALGQYQEAIRCYDEALRLDPRDSAVWHDKGNTLSAIGRWEGALNCFNEALIIDPRDERAWYNKGICLTNLGRPEEALPCCNKAIELDSSFAVAWQAKALIEESRGRVQDAVASYKRFIALASASDAAAIERVQQHVSALEAAPPGPEPAA